MANCVYCKCNFKYSLKYDLLPVCGKEQCREKYLKDYKKILEMFANIGGRTIRSISWTK